MELFVARGGIGPPYIQSSNPYLNKLGFLCIMIVVFHIYFLRIYSNLDAVRMYSHILQEHKPQLLVFGFHYTNGMLEA